jgi:hypothetical protein
MPTSTYDNNKIKPMGDLRTHIGHGLLWSRHIEVECSTLQMEEALAAEGYQLSYREGTPDYSVYAMAKTVCECA